MRRALDIAAFLMVMVLMWFFRQDYVFLAVYIFIFPYFYFTGRKRWILRLILSTALALTWSMIAKGYYGYRLDVPVILGMNTYAFFAWTLGLFTAYMFYTHLNSIVKCRTWLKKMLLFLAVYWPFLILVETLAYHVFLFRNIPTGMYPGLPICDCIHAPVWMQFAYLVMGPLYFFACEALGLGEDGRSRLVKKRSLTPAKKSD